MDARPWLAVTNGQALRFFFEHLRDVTDDEGALEPELLYNASVLAHFATTSSACHEFPATPSSLSTRRKASRPVMVLVTRASGIDSSLKTARVARASPA